MYMYIFIYTYTCIYVYIYIYIYIYICIYRYESCPVGLTRAKGCDPRRVFDEWPRAPPPGAAPPEPASSIFIY